MQPARVDATFVMIHCCNEFRVHRRGATAPDKPWDTNKVAATVFKCTEKVQRLPLGVLAHESRCNGFRVHRTDATPGRFECQGLTCVAMASECIGQMQRLCRHRHRYFVAMGLQCTEEVQPVSDRFAASCNLVATVFKCIEQMQRRLAVSPLSALCGQEMHRLVEENLCKPVDNRRPRP